MPLSAPFVLRFVDEFADRVTSPVTVRAFLWLMLWLSAYFTSPLANGAVQDVGEANFYPVSLVFKNVYDLTEVPWTFFSYPRYLNSSPILIDPTEGRSDSSSERGCDRSGVLVKEGSLLADLDRGAKDSGGRHPVGIGLVALSISCLRGL